MQLLKSLFCFVLICCSFFSMAQQSGTDSTNNNNPVFTKVDAEAEFPGGPQGWTKFIADNLRSVASENGAPAGYYTVIAKFIVDKEGVISNIETETKLGFGMEQEVKRVISKSGKWKPAMQNGRPVKAYRIQPVVFFIEDSDFEIKSEAPYTLFTNTDNEITVTATKVKPKDIGVEIPGATVTANGDGKFTVRINKPGRILIAITDTRKDKSIGTASINVKNR